MTEKEYLKLGNPDEIDTKKLYKLLVKEIIKALTEKGYQIPENSLLDYPNTGFIEFTYKNQSDNQESFYFELAYIIDSIQYQWANNDLSFRKTILSNESEYVGLLLKSFEKNIKEFLKNNDLYREKEDVDEQIDR